MKSRGAQRRSLFAPEVVQTSAMDCGPASLKCLLEGSGIPVSYGRLREACQTDVDGTSIDTIEEIARQLGLNAEQEMLPADHLLLPEAEALPALAVTVLPNGFTHFVVVWRHHGPLVQLMDPATGRRWLRCDRFLRDVYIHELELPAADWHEWARSERFLRPMKRRLKRIGLDSSGGSLLDTAVAESSWRPLAALDAAARLVDSLVRAGGVRRGREAQRLLISLFEEASGAAASEPTAIPESYWSARPAMSRGGQGGGGDSGSESDSDSGSGSNSGGEGDRDTEKVILRGAVLLRVRGRQSPHRGPSRTGGPETDGGAAAEILPDERAPPDGGTPPLSPELARALDERPTRPGRELLRLLRGGGALSFTVLLGGLAISAGSVILEAVLLRGAIDVGRQLGLVTQRLEAVGYFFLFVLALLLVEFSVASGLLRLGRRLETRLRLAFLEKVPRLMDRYFQSRPVSDMAERSHSIQRLREVARLGGQLVRAVFGLVVTGCAIAWIFPAGGWIAALAAFLAVALPLAFRPRLEELDLRLRTHSGALSRFYLDALLGLAAVRAHGAERSVRREHESLLVEWAEAGVRQVRAALTLDGLQALGGYGIAAFLLLSYASRGGDPVGALLVAYWTLYLPVLGEEVALLFRQYPTHRNLALRLLEPIGAPEEAEAEEGPRQNRSRVEPGGAGIALESVTVVAAGHRILEKVDLVAPGGSHIAIVGASGAGKSSLVGLLLGWHRAAHGRVLVDGELLDGAGLERIRPQTVWVDPAVQLWNRSLLSNLTYGAVDGDTPPVGRLLEQADLHGIVERLPEGLQTPLGEGGGLVSGGEGQRVRFGRGLARPDARLVILDEPFRGLDRAMRRELLGRARRRWRDATLFCITHDVSETRTFPRVIVIDGGRLVEDGSPEVLAADPGSRYHALVQAEESVRREIWSSSVWRRMRLEAGRLREGSDGTTC